MAVFTNTMSGFCGINLNSPHTFTPGWRTDVYAQAQAERDLATLPRGGEINCGS